MVICILKQFDGTYSDICIKSMNNDFVKWLKDIEYSWFIENENRCDLLVWEE